MFSTRAISRLLTPWACNSRIVVRWCWLNMFFLLWDFWNFAGQTMEFRLRRRDRSMDLGALEGNVCDRGADQASVLSANDRRDHLQIPQQLGDPGRGRIG